ncbi:hypothetical protein FB567DRAFT_523066 [Paraphoma chrysanthemicola]|uniref:Uncharacterized protein n=1 Tax=Paraphoma chrysanthemicola TaxID=798071 RepID=A0A8K0W0V5_9PLEO|nr:hypothetical protein FB567DRAFT_523066 [Paraphoma chrysanthemicola]
MGPAGITRSAQACISIDLPTLGSESCLSRGRVVLVAIRISLGGSTGRRCANSALSMSRSTIRLSVSELTPSDDLEVSSSMAFCSCLLLSRMKLREAAFSERDARANDNAPEETLLRLVACCSSEDESSDEVESRRAHFVHEDFDTAGGLAIAFLGFLDCLDLFLADILRRTDGSSSELESSTSSPELELSPVADSSFELALTYSEVESSESEM